MLLSTILSLRAGNLADIQSVADSNSLGDATVNQMAHYIPLQIVQLQAFVARIVRPAFDFNDTAKIACRTSSRPFLAEIRAVENLPLLGRGILQQVDQN